MDGRDSRSLARTRGEGSGSHEGRQHRTFLGEARLRGSHGDNKKAGEASENAVTVCALDRPATWIPQREGTNSGCDAHDQEVWEGGQRMVGVSITAALASADRKNRIDHGAP